MDDRTGDPAYCRPGTGFRRAAAIALATVAVLAPASVRADDQRVAQIAATLLPRVSQTATAAAGGRGGADAVQAQYDAARDLQEALAGALPVSSACAALAVTLARYAQAQVDAAEGVDRLRPAQTARAGTVAARVLAGYPAARARCLANPGPAPRPARRPPIDDPGSYEAFFGAVRARAPAGAVRASVTLGGELVARAAVEGGWVRARISSAPAHGRLIVTFTSATGAVVGRAISEAVWLLPASASAPVPRIEEDASLGAQLARATATFSGISAVYTLDLRTGKAGSANADARFPAASTVKLGVLAAALRRFGPRPEAQPPFADLRALAGWSSNLAANRLAGEDRRSGARAGRAPSPRRERQHLSGHLHRGHGGPALPAGRLQPRDHRARPRDRLTTLQRAATGDARARAAAGLSVHEARVGLGLLLSSQPVADNLGMLRPALSSALPIAQKQGWINDARLTAAIVYSPRGTRVVVICASSATSRHERAAPRPACRVRAGHPMSPAFESVDELAARIPDGASVAVPADYSGCAMAAVRALIRRGARDLHADRRPAGRHPGRHADRRGLRGDDRDLGRRRSASTARRRASRRPSGTAASRDATRPARRFTRVCRRPRRACRSCRCAA